MSSGSSRIAKNTLAISISDFLGLLLSFIFIAVFARYLGASSYGTYAFAIAFVALFRMFFDLGLSSLNIREISKDKEKLNYYFGNSLILEIISSVATIVVIGILINALGYDRDTSYVVIVSALIFSIEMISYLIYSIFTAYEKRIYESIVRIAGKSMYVAIGFLGIALNLPLIQIVSLMVIYPLAQFLIGYLLMTRIVTKPKIELEPESWPNLLKLSIPFALSGLIYDIYFNIDMIMLSLFQGEVAVAYYSIAYRIIISFLIVPSALVITVFPVLSKMYVSSHENLIFAFQKITKYLLVISLPIAVGVCLIADLAIVTIFGSQYSSSVIALQILVWVVVFHFMFLISGTTLGAIDRQTLTVVSLLIGVLLNISLNLVLIPLYSYVGAAIATVLTELALFVQYRYYLKKNGINIRFLKFVKKPIFAAIVMGIIVFLLKKTFSFLPAIQLLLILIPIGVLVYVGVLVVIKGISREDWTIFREII